MTVIIAKSCRQFALEMALRSLGILTRPYGAHPEHLIEVFVPEWWCKSGEGRFLAFIQNVRFCVEKVDN